MTTTATPSEIVVRTLPTPNPFALKFIVNSSLKAEGKATFHSSVECEELPLARDLFSIEGVKQVYFFQNTLTVTHSGDLTSDEVSDKVCSVIKARLNVHNPSFGEAEAKPKPRALSNDPTVSAIEEILDRTVRPGLQADGGDIEVVSFENNDLKIVYQGACGGCPSAMMGTLDAIQGILRNELSNEQITVTPV